MNAQPNFSHHLESANLTNKAAVASASPKAQPSPRAAFSLVELMVVLSIIGLMATLGLPALKGIAHTNTMSSATRQLLDDLALARQSAISGRTTVYMVFVPPNFFQGAPINLMTFDQKKQLTNLLSGQFSAYALLAKRTPGDQPGHPTPRYLTEWRNLPEGIVIATNKFVYYPSVQWARQANALLRPFSYNDSQGFPFPNSKSPYYALPYIAFNSQGLLDHLGPNPIYPDEYIPLAKASVFYHRDAQGALDFGPPDVKEVPPGNSIDTYQRIHINWITGRARLEKKEIQ